MTITQEITATVETAEYGRVRVCLETDGTVSITQTDGVDSSECVMGLTLQQLKDVVTAIEQTARGALS